MFAVEGIGRSTPDPSPRWRVRAVFGMTHSCMTGIASERGVCDDGMERESRVKL